ncbi:MAG TPA: superoxide dismutase family protein [Burkholderiaceae bacterium]|nr:superoxide dismutase family protein [Burkholderiaceae bacterium]
MRLSLLAVAATVALSACGTSRTTTESMAEGPKAVAMLEPTTAGKASGTVSFVQKGDKVLVVANVQGLTPGAEHGFHIHETPDCSGDGMKAGAHFNPDANPHGHPGQAQRHAGAMFNLKADSNGVATFKQEVDLITLTEGKYNVIGKPVIVHARADDYVSQPLGNAGGRIACGLIVKR